MPPSLLLRLCIISTMVFLVGCSRVLPWQQVAPTATAESQAAPTARLEPEIVELAAAQDGAAETPTAETTGVAPQTAEPEPSSTPPPVAAPLEPDNRVETAPDPVEATVSASIVNIRNRPGLSESLVIGTVDGGTVLQVVERSADGLWLRVCCVVTGAEAEWVSAEYLEPSSAERTNEEAAGVPLDGEGIVVAVEEALVNIRTGPGTVYPIVSQVAAGDLLRVIGRSEAGDWVEICCIDGATGSTWIILSLVTVQQGDVGVAPIVAAPEPPIAIAQGGLGGQAALAAAPAPGLPGDGAFGAASGTNPLTGLPMPGERNGQRPLVVCINNDYAARPQFGISQADVMVEYIMEGFGITRFSGLFYGEDVARIGPVRSARLINYYLSALYNAGLACSGASDQVRYTLKHESPFPYLDIDLDDPSNVRYSVSEGSDYRTRLRTNTAQLRRWLSDWGVEEPASIRGFSFGAAPQGAPATLVTIPYPAGTGSQVDYRYDAGSGRYMRSMGGAAHLDGNNGVQVAVENVVVQYVPHEITEIVEDSLGSKSIRLNLFGSGQMILFRDGQAFVGQWRSESRGDLPRFYLDDGSEVPMKAGKSWFSIVPFDYLVDFR